MKSIKGKALACFMALVLAVGMAPSMALATETGGDDTSANSDDVTATSTAKDSDKSSEDASADESEGEATEDTTADGSSDTSDDAVVPLSNTDADDEEESDEDGEITTYSSEPTAYGFDVTQILPTDTCKMEHDYATNDDGTNTFKIYFFCDGDEEWIDQNITFTVEDVTSKGAINVIEEAGVSYVEPTVTVGSAEEVFVDAQNYHYSRYVTPPLEENGSTDTKVKATSGKEIVVETGMCTRYLKTTAYQDGKVVDTIYTRCCGAAEGDYASADKALFEKACATIESKLWTSDMSNLEKLEAIADYIKTVSHYPDSDTTKAEYNPTWADKWSVDGSTDYTRIWWNFDNKYVDWTMALEGEQCTCLAADMLYEIALSDLGLIGITVDDTGVGEGVYVGSGANSSNPTNSSHSSLVYQAKDGTRTFVDAQGVSYSASNSKVTCEAHDCESSLIPIDPDCGPEITGDTSGGSSSKSISSCTIILSNETLKYTGSARCPTVVVKDGSTVLTEDTDYTVSYSNNTNVGTAKVTVTGMGKYSGTVTKTFTIEKGNSYVTAKAASTSLQAGKTTTITVSGQGKITYSSSDTSVATVNSSGKVTAKAIGTATITVKAAGNSNWNSSSTTVTIKVNSLASGKISSLTNASKGITVKWSKVAGAKGYYVYRKTGSRSYSKIKTVKSGSTVSYKDTDVLEGITYTYKVVPYSGSIQGSFTAKKIVRVGVPSIKSVKSSKAKKMTVKWKKREGATGYQIRYSTSKSFKSYKTVKVKGTKKISKTISKLKKGKKYYVQVRSYTSVSGTKYYSAWSSKKSVKVKKK